MRRPQWQFIETGIRGSGLWTWRRLNGRGAIQKQSATLQTYGAVVCDAIKNGFEPGKESWVSISASCVARFEPQNGPCLVPGGARSIRSVGVNQRAHASEPPGMPPRGRSASLAQKKARGKRAGRS
jgi:hypothetical protein